MSEAINRCVRCNDTMPSFRVNNLCEDCYREEWQNDHDDGDDEPQMCEECHGEGYVEEDGGVMNECETCWGTGWDDE